MNFPQSQSKDNRPSLPLSRFTSNSETQEGTEDNTPFCEPEEVNPFTESQDDPYSPIDVNPFKQESAERKTEKRSLN